MSEPVELPRQGTPPLHQTGVGRIHPSVDTCPECGKATRSFIRDRCPRCHNTVTCPTCGGSCNDYENCTDPRHRRYHHSQGCPTCNGSGRVPAGSAR